MMMKAILTDTLIPPNEDRSVNPGDTRTLEANASACPPLNEGRGVNPGDTLAWDSNLIPMGERSTKAGA